MKSRLFSALKKSTRRQNSKLRRDAAWQRRPRLETLENRCLLAASPVLGTTIEAVNINDNAYNMGAAILNPPDPHGAIGPNHVLNVVNVSLQWFDKPDTVGGTAVQQMHTSLNNFFAPLSPISTAMLFDAKALYDPYAGRFLVTALEVHDTPALRMSRILIAVSDDSDPNGTWRFQSINSTVNVATTTTVGGVTTTTNTPHWTDYPGFALDKGAIYVTGNLFGFGATGAPNGNRLWIIEKGVGTGGFYDGGTARMVWDTSSATAGQQPWDVTKYTSLDLTLGTAANPAKFRNLQPATVLANKADGSDAPLGTWLAAYDGDTTGNNEFVSVIRVETPLTAPKFTLTRVNVGDIEAPNLAAVNGPGFFPVNGAPQKGSNSLIDVNDRRTLSAVWRNNNLYVTTEIYPQSGDDINQVTAHWFRFAANANSASVSLADQGNVGGEDLGFATFTFMPSVAVDYQDNMAIGFAASGPTLYAGAYYALRAKDDAAGTIRTARALAPGLDIYALYGSPSRWGDYSFVGVDPSDQATFWVFNEYALPQQGTTGQWGTRWGSFAFAPPAPTTPTNPNQLTAISGIVYDDSADEDGVYRSELGEMPLANRQIYLDLDKDGYYDLTEPSVVTDGTGTFTLNYQLAPGTYYLQEALPQGWHLTQPASPATYYTITVNASYVATVSPTGTVSGQTISLDFGNSNKNGFNWGTAPAPYPTTAAQNGASHVVVPGFGLGASPTVVGGSDGVPTVDSVGGPYPGVVFNAATPLIVGRTSPIQVTVATGGRTAGRLYGWIDFNGDGDWKDQGEQVFSGAQAPTGVYTLNVTVPATAKKGFTYARFRYGAASDVNLTDQGSATAGEVEDYKIQILGIQPEAVADTFTVEQNSSNNSLDVLANDIPSPAGRQSLKIVSVSGAAGTVTIDDRGTASVYTDDVLNYTPKSGSLATDSFTYTIRDMSNPDNNTNSSSAGVTVTLEAPALPLTAVDDSFTLANSTTSLNLDVLKNDFSGPTNVINIFSLNSVTSTGTATSGTISTVTSGGKQMVRYTPNSTFRGADQFQYTVMDAAGLTSTATVTVHVPPETQLDKVKFWLEAYDTKGNLLPVVNGLPQIEQGQLFQMQVWVQDMRSETGYPPMDSGLVSPADRGVYSAYADLLYDRNAVSFDGTVSFGTLFGGPDYDPTDPYRPGQNYDATIPGLINELGAFQDFVDPVNGPVPFATKRLLFSATYTANALGIAEFKTDPADITEHEVVLNKPANVPVPYTNVEYGTTSVRVVALEHLVRIQLTPTDAAGNTVTRLVAGQDFWVRAYVDDLRTNAPKEGVYSAYLNIDYNPTLALPVKVSTATNPLGFDITWGALFTDANGFGVNRSGSVITPGFVSEVGATQVSLQGVPFTGEQLLFKIHFVAQSTAVGGSLTFDAKAATLQPVHEVTVFPENSVPTAQVEYVDTNAIAVAGVAGGEGEYTNPYNPYDVNGDSFVSPVDALLLVNFLNLYGSALLPGGEGEGGGAASPHYFFDVNHDFKISSGDVLSVINCLNNAAAGEGEDAGGASVIVAAAPPLPGVGSDGLTPVALVQAASGDARVPGATANAAEESAETDDDLWLGRLGADQADLETLLSDGFAKDILGGWAQHAS